MLQPSRRIHQSSNPTWGASHDHRPTLNRVPNTDKLDQILDGKEEVTDFRPLSFLPVDPRSQSQFAWIWNLRRRADDWSNRSEFVKRFAVSCLVARLGLQLPESGCHIIAYGVAKDEAFDVIVVGDVPTLLANDYAELALDESIKNSC